MNTHGPNAHQETQMQTYIDDECAGDESSTPECTVLSALWAWFVRLHDEWPDIERLLIEAPAPFGLCMFDWWDECKDRDPDPNEIPF